MPISCNATLGGSGVLIGTVAFTTGSGATTVSIYSSLTCNTGYTKSAISGAATNICTTPDASIQFGSCTPRCEWLGLVGSQWQWVDAITRASCRSCTTYDGCKNWNCNDGGSGGSYRWDGKNITCP